MKTIRPLILMVLFLGLYSVQVSAQKNVDTQQQLWTRYFLKLKLSDNYQLLQELEERTFWFPWRQHTFDSRIHLERTLGKGWNTGIGFAYFLQSYPQDPRITDYYNLAELRPLLELTFEHNLSEKLNLNHRYWSEFRFFEQPNGSFEYGTNRTRYKLELKYAATSQLTLKAFDEIFLNIGGKVVQNVFDQNRVGASVQYTPWKSVGFELGYFNIFQQRASVIDFYNRHVTRLTIYHTIDFRNSKN